MIIDWLLQDWRELLAHDNRVRVILWCDVRGEFRTFLPEVARSVEDAGLALLALDAAAGHGALWLKWAAELGPGAGRKVILWLPCAREASSQA